MSESWETPRGGRSRRRRRPRRGREIRLVDGAHAVDCPSTPPYLLLLQLLLPPRPRPWQVGSSIREPIAVGRAVGDSRTSDVRRCRTDVRIGCGRSHNCTGSEWRRSIPPCPTIASPALAGERPVIHPPGAEGGRWRGSSRSASKWTVPSSSKLWIS